MSGQRVDVLAVLDHIADCDYIPVSTADLNATRAAVAELIEECERLCDVADGMKRNADGMSRKSPIALTLRTAAANIISLRPLLTNVGSAS